MKRKIITVAIVSGRTNSTYAIGFVHDPKAVILDQTFRDDYGLNTTKVPTTLVLNSKQEFVAFGQEAEEFYSQLLDDNRHREYYFFRLLPLKVLNQLTVSTLFMC